MAEAKYEALAAGIVNDIRAGRYTPGQRIPSVRDFMADGHGEATVRRAMRWLQDAGWVVAGTRGGGSFVADPLPDVAPTLEDRVAALEAWRAEVEGGPQGA